MSKDVAVEKFLAVAFSYSGFAEQGGENRGQVVERMLKSVGLGPGYPWCAAAVHYWGHWSQYNYVANTSQWTLPATGGCAELGRFAEKKGILRTTPTPGSVFLVYHPALKRFGHTGIALRLQDNGRWATIEGNTNTDGSREGWQVAVRDGEHGRMWKDTDRFIDWTALLP